MAEFTDSDPDSATDDNELSSMYGESSAYIGYSDVSNSGDNNSPPSSPVLQARRESVEVLSPSTGDREAIDTLLSIFPQFSRHVVTQCVEQNVKDTPGLTNQQLVDRSIDYLLSMQDDDIIIEQPFDMLRPAPPPNVNERAPPPKAAKKSTKANSWIITPQPSSGVGLATGLVPKAPASSTLQPPKQPTTTAISGQFDGPSTSTDLLSHLVQQGPGDDPPPNGRSFKIMPDGRFICKAGAAVTEEDISSEADHIARLIGGGFTKQFISDKLNMRITQHARMQNVVNSLVNVTGEFDYIKSCNGLEELGEKEFGRAVGHISGAGPSYLPGYDLPAYSSNSSGSEPTYIGSPPTVPVYHPPAFTHSLSSPAMCGAPQYNSVLNTQSYPGSSTSFQGPLTRQTTFGDLRVLQAPTKDQGSYLNHSACGGQVLNQGTFGAQANQGAFGAKALNQGAFGAKASNQGAFGAQSLNHSSFGNPALDQSTFVGPPVDQPTFSGPSLDQGSYMGTGLDQGTFKHHCAFGGSPMDQGVFQVGAPQEPFFAQTPASSNRNVNRYTGDLDAPGASRYTHQLPQHPYQHTTALPPHSNQSGLPAPPAMVYQHPPHTNDGINRGPWATWPPHTNNPPASSTTPANTADTWRTDLTLDRYQFDYGSNQFFNHGVNLPTAAKQPNNPLHHNLSWPPAQPTNHHDLSWPQPVFMWDNSNNSVHNNYFSPADDPHLPPLPPNESLSTTGPSIPPAFVNPNHPNPTAAQVPVTNVQSGLDDWTNQVTMMFPDADVDYIKDQLTKSSTQPDPVNIVCNHLIETEKTYPRKAKVICKPSLAKKRRRDYTDYSSEVSSAYQNDCVDLLEKEFLFIPAHIIKKAVQAFKYHYVPTKTCLMDTMRGARTVEPVKGSDTTRPNQGYRSGDLQLPGYGAPISFKLLKGYRSRVTRKTLDPDLQEEIDYMANQQAKTKLSEDPSQLYECGCCYGEFSIAGMVQCNDGHLFCSQCVESYVREAVFGQGRIRIHCMTGDCTAGFLRSLLEDKLPPSLLEQFDDRLLTENINLADITDLVRCPAPDCDFAAIMDPNDKVFRCQNSACLKETCRYCEVDWSEHIGIPCREIEKKAEVNIRLTYEEKMTEAKVRTCAKCKAKFFKEEGCNKMTCRCGYTMCYICRASGIDYKHFCQHPLDPGKSCTQCKSCLLWTNPEADERRALAELQQEAQSERKNKGYEAPKTIG